jgi:hypothetical protein
VLTGNGAKGPEESEIGTIVATLRLDRLSHDGSERAVEGSPVLDSCRYDHSRIFHFLPNLLLDFTKVANDVKLAPAPFVAE